MTPPRQYGLQWLTYFLSSYGESHCASVGCIVDGCPPGMELTEADIQPQLTRRRPGQSALTTPRDEKDRVQIQSGTEFGITLGTPIGLLVKNEDQRPHDYKGDTMAGFPRPSHAGIFTLNLSFRGNLLTCSSRLHVPREVWSTSQQWWRPKFCP